MVVGALLSVGLFFVGRYTRHASTGCQCRSHEPTSPAKSIAVLPFDNLSRDPGQRLFRRRRAGRNSDPTGQGRGSEGDLAHFDAAFQELAGKFADIAKQLGVMNILEGSVQKSNDQVRVNVQLINAMTDAHLWAEIYDRKLTDIFAVESDIAKTIADTLAGEADRLGETNDGGEANERSRTAYELYHKGRSFWEKRTGDNIPKAIAFYEQAHRARSELCAGLRRSGQRLLIAVQLYADAPARCTRKSERSGAQSSQLDPNLAEAHPALGKVSFFSESIFRERRASIERAIELKPNDADSTSLVRQRPLVSARTFEEAIAEGKRAIELDPLSPIINADLATRFIYARRYDEAIAQ